MIRQRTLKEMVKTTGVGVHAPINYQSVVLSRYSSEEGCNFMLRMREKRYRMLR